MPFQTMLCCLTGSQAKCCITQLESGCILQLADRLAGTAFLSGKHCLAECCLISYFTHAQSHQPVSSGLFF